MNTLDLLRSIESNVISAIESDNKLLINDITVTLINKNNWNKEDIEEAKIIIQISNSLYNNTDLVVLPLEDGMYDLLLEAVRRYVPEIQSGTLPQNLGSFGKIYSAEETTTNPVYHVPDEEVQRVKDMMFPSIFMQKQFDHNSIFPTTLLEEENRISKRVHDTKHEHPELVGTLHKCKIVLTKEAQDKGVVNDRNVKILERDWLAPLIGNAFNGNDIVDMILSLKYDGISIEADVNTEVVSARTRGDTDLSVASDLTPIFKGYKFPNAIDLGENIGMKFEAIITYPNLAIINRLKGCQYINGRTAIIGVLGSSDAYRYRDLITLVPLQTTLKDENGEPLDRLVEIEFMNKFYTRDQLFKYQVISGNYVSLLYQINRYTQEAEFARDYIPFMYDGIVAEFYDPRIRKLLGRKNSINEYAMAVKFNPIKKKSIFRGFKYTIGQNGVITPMFYFDPVEFLGAIHDHTTGYSYEHFNEINLYIGDVIDIDYNHDVMPYISKPDIQFNRDNHNRMPTYDEMFPAACPFCGSNIAISSSGKSAYCTNPKCYGREMKRITNMVSKLGIKDIAEERLSQLKVSSLRELYSYDPLKIDELIGPGNGAKFKQQLESLRVNPIPDYILIGSLGFTGISAKTWRLVLENIYLLDLFNIISGGNYQEAYSRLTSIKGIGNATANTIMNEFHDYIEDIDFIIRNFNILYSFETKARGPKIRFTGFRDRELVGILSNMGYDVDDNASVTKDTNVLLVPYDGYNSGTKYQKAIRYGVPVISVSRFRSSLNL